jgi:hypothetical protein
MWADSDQFQREPDVDDDRQKFEWINMKTGFVTVYRFPSSVDMLHWETVGEKSISHDSPHNGELRRPSS